MQTATKPIMAAAVTSRLQAPGGSSSSADTATAPLSPASGGRNCRKRNRAPAGRSPLYAGGTALSCRCCWVGVSWLLAWLHHLPGVVASSVARADRPAAATVAAISGDRGG